ncbi:MAG: energy-coupling factor transporter transmembrane protein EcfT [Methanobrevibacter sp.]|nr:energy-coupling factor transporter transmembrane protein EcfT [Methanobrevibacter sp.]
MRDITLGQYINGDSIIHRLDPRLKLIVSLLFIVFLFIIKTPVVMTIVFCLILLLYKLIRIPIKMLLVSIKPVLPVILFTSALNMFFVAGNPVLSFGKVSISDRGIIFAFMLSLRIIVLLAGTSLLTYTTTPIQLTGAIESIFSPLHKIGFPVEELAMMMTIALRFIPTLMNETDKTISAQKSRGADMETGNFIQRIKALTPILIPLFISAFRRADELALAMECRCYNSEGKRTKLHELKYGKNDLIAALCSISVILIMSFIDWRMNAAI